MKQKVIIFGININIKEEILEQLNSISVVEVDNEFNIISYE